MSKKPTIEELKNKYSGKKVRVYDSNVGYSGQNCTVITITIDGMLVVESDSTKVGDDFVPMLINPKACRLLKSIKKPSIAKDSCKNCGTTWVANGKLPCPIC
jgi:hypothetical protein